MRFPDRDHPDEISLDVEWRIDAVCLEFENALIGECSPHIEEYLGTESGKERSAMFRQLLAIEIDYLGITRVNPEDYKTRFPNMEEVVDEILRLPESQFEHGYRPEDTLGRYTIERFIAQGSFGKVYAATDRDSGRTVAIKCLDKNSGFGNLPTDEGALSSMLDHPRIVKIYEVFHQEGGSPAIAMQFISGESLYQRLLAAPLPQVQTVDLLIQIAEAAHFAHQHGIVHRDLNPRNILLDRDNQPFISDFGLAIHQDGQESRVGEVAGSLSYMSPEQIRGESQWLDGRSDIWSLGVIMYELLVGRRPFMSEDSDQLANEILVRDLKPLRQLGDDIPAELELICMKCLAKPVADRFATAGDVATALNQFLEAPQELKSVRPSQHWLPLTITGLLSCAVLAVVAMFAGALPRVSQEPAVSANIVIEVFRARDQPKAGTHRGSISRRNVAALPLRYGEGVRFSIDVVEPKYVYVLIVDTDGRVHPVFPWKAGDWNSFPSTERKVRDLTLPQEHGESFPIVGSTTSGETGSGLATLVVMTRREPLVSDMTLAKLPRVMADQPLRHPKEVYWFRNGVLIERVEARERGIEVSTTMSISDVLILNQQRLHEALGDMFEMIDAVAIPIQERDD